MKETLRYGLILGIICILASGLLAGLNSVTRSRIFAQAKEQEEETLKEVFSSAARFAPVTSGEEVIYYKAYDKADKLLGVAFKASGKGYSSIIETMAGMRLDGTLTGVSVISQNETPGLGARVAERGFMQQFSGRVIPSLDGVQAITGATISSRAVIDAVREKGKKIQALTKDEK